MYCPNCKKEYDFVCCPDCGTKMIEKPQSEENGFNMNLRGSAVNGSINVSDNSVRDDHSTHITTTNNTTINERDKTLEEIQQEREAAFIADIEQLCQGGVMDQAGYAALKILAQKKSIPIERADQLIDSMRSNIAQKAGGASNNFLAEKTVREISGAVECCCIDVLKQKFPALRQLATNTADNEFLFYYNMLYASFSPESCTVELMNSRIDKYWQVYWSCIAYIKSNNTDKVGELLPRLGCFGFPQGNIALLMAMINLAHFRKNPQQEFYKQQVADNLDEASNIGISDQLIPLWLAVNQMNSDDPKVEDRFRFYYTVTLKELCTLPSMPKAAKLPDMPVEAMKIPPLPQQKKFSSKDIDLPELQGFDPLKASEQLFNDSMQPMDMKSMPGMSIDVQPMNIPPMPGVAMGAQPMNIPPMPGAAMGAQPMNIPPMPCNGIPPIPTEEK